MEKTILRKTFHKHGLRTTTCREDVFLLFLEQSKALSHPDLEKALKGKYDRVTLYRTLKAFLNCGILHKIMDDSGTTSYALCHGCSSDEHNDNHIHFKCIHCENVECLENHNVPKVNLPDNYIALNTSFLVSGVCRNCKE